jgi:hypothetical protein
MANMQNENNTSLDSTELHNTSLDSTELNNKKIVYFKSTKNQHVFNITEEQAGISSLLSSMDLSNNNFDNPIILDDIYIENENTKHLIYEINTYEMLNYIYEYMNLWKDDIKDICYIKEEQIQIHNPALILVEKDYLFIKKYIDDNINNIITKQKIYDKFNINEFNEKKNYNIMITIQILGELICQSEFLEIQSLANKLYAWCACLVWNTSLIDMYEANNDPYFMELQNKALDDYYQNNKDKKDFYEQFLENNNNDNEDSGEKSEETSGQELEEKSGQELEEDLEEESE